MGGLVVFMTCLFFKESERGSISSVIHFHWPSINYVIFNLIRLQGKRGDLPSFDGLLASSYFTFVYI